MKNSLILLCVLLCCDTASFAQRQCGIVAEKAAMTAKDPSWAQRFQAQVAALQGIADNYKLQKASGAAERTTGTISPVPVIFHIIVSSDELTLMGGMSGIQQRVDSQIAVLNRDYNRGNSDSTFIPAGWKPLYGNVGVHFGAAHIGPTGASTPGYEVKVTSASFSAGGNGDYSLAKYDSTGGLSAWDNTKYANVWCINFADNSGLLGITTPRSFTVGFGAIPNAEMGICINFESLGKRASPSDNYIPTGVGSDYYDQGRTLTHEMGHFFEIWHPWGDDGGQCTTWSSDTTVNSITCTPGVGNDDGLSDTPPESDAVYGNPAYTVLNGTENDCCMMHGAVNTQPIGIACLSFLDYTDDIAMHLFTTDQAAAMASMVLVPPGTGTGATGSGTIGESYSLTQNPTLLVWPEGITQVPAGNNFNIYPNPATGIVNITFDQNSSALNDISITNIMGQEVQHINTAGNQNNYYSIDLSGMSKGIYFVRCNFASGSITRKILLQ